ncbi:class I SAM-dependent methyltransferase [Vibrio sp. PNB22_3_1]
MSKSFYEKESIKYIQHTLGLDMHTHIKPFIDQMLTDSKKTLLEVGPGSGRDLRIFVDAGFECTGIEQDEFFSEYACLYSGAIVHHKSLLEYHSQKRFDAIWCNASLVHTPRKDFPKTLNKLSDLLTDNGFAYISLKLGSDYQEDTRQFTCFNLKSLKRMFNQSKLIIGRCYLSKGNDSVWINLWVRQRNR